MSYNAGTKVRIAFDGGSETTDATIVGRQISTDIYQPDTLTYRDSCPTCTASKIGRHVLGERGSYIAN